MSVEKPIGPLINLEERARVSPVRTPHHIGASRRRYGNPHIQGGRTRSRSRSISFELSFIKAARPALKPVFYDLCPNELDHPRVVVAIRKIVIQCRETVTLA
jgi:hypothetical protein